jgi:hypothetical protein
MHAHLIPPSTPHGARWYLLRTLRYHEDHAEKEIAALGFAVYLPLARV